MEKNAQEGVDVAEASTAIIAEPSQNEMRRFRNGGNNFESFETLLNADQSVAADVMLLRRDFLAGADD